MKRNAAAPAMLTNNYDEVHFVHIPSLTPVSTHHLGLMYGGSNHLRGGL